MIDPTKGYNPYDFANPVRKRALFSGRAQELREIQYYLDQAQHAPRPINIALLGARAAGKTSVLNMIEIEARERDLCVARIDLNEGDVASPLAFFFKLFDGVFTAAVATELQDAATGKSYPYGGRRGGTYEAYLDMISAYEVPEDRRFCPFLFPIQYAKARARGHENIAVSDQAFRSDLMAIQEEVRRPIVVLFDEGNVLSEKRVLLQMVRNIFMNTPGFMLVIAGTAELFPAMDDVFSPIVRQFKKIDVKPFDSREETESCIKKPLESIGITDPKSVFDIRTYTELTEIHNLTGGRPYEIQLLCHFMFKRMQTDKAQRMKLNLETLDDVLRELGRGKDIFARPIITAVKNLPGESLRALAWLATTTGRTSFDRLWSLESVIRGTERWTPEVLLGATCTLSDAGIIRMEDDKVIFCGDDFDRLYCKYFARKKGVRLEIDDLPFEVHATMELSNYLTRYGLRLFAYSWRQQFDAIAGVPTSAHSGETDRPLSVLIPGLCALTEAGPISRSHPRLAAEVLGGMLARAIKGDKQQRIIGLNLRLADFALELPFYVAPSEKFDHKSLSAALADMAVRATAAGGELCPWDVIVDVPTAAQIVSIAVDSQEEVLRSSIGEGITEEMARLYVAKRPLAEWWPYAELALPLASSLDASEANNLAYVCLANRQVVPAIEFLKAAVQRSKVPTFRALTRYNLAIAMLRDGQEGPAGELLAEACEIAALLERDDDNVECLFKPSWSGSEWIVDEVWDISLKKTASEARDLLATTRASAVDASSVSREDGDSVS